MDTCLDSTHLAYSVHSARLASRTEPCGSATAALERLRMGNARFMTGQTRSHRTDSDWRRVLATGQRPFAIVLTCADSRVSPEILFDQGLGDLFVLRVAGNVMNRSILGSMEYAVHEFDVKCVVVLGHDFCGGVQAILDARQPCANRSRPAMHNFSHLATNIRTGNDLSQDPEEASRQAVRHNLFYQTTVLARKSVYLAQKVMSDELRIVPALYHLEIGEVEWFRSVKISKKSRINGESPNV